jgi:hypothetical protein
MDNFDVDITFQIYVYIVYDSFFLKNKRINRGGGGMKHVS